MSVVLGLLFVQFILLSSAQFCDRRASGGELLCCKGANSSCWVRVPSTPENALPPGQTRVCYCDEYCHTTGDCCSDLKRVCQGAQDCVLSPWASWSKCSEQCGFGVMKRRRAILQAPRNGGKACPIRHEKKGCFQQNCKGDMVLAQILPAEYRNFKPNSYAEILPHKKEETEIQKIRKRFRSHCVNFKLMSKHPYCEGTWAGKLKLSKPMCVECQPNIMDDQGFCKGEGIVGNYTSWVATHAKQCSGLWMRVGEKIENCKCEDTSFQNFIFV